MAIATLKLAVELDPRNIIARQGLGFAFAFNNMPDSAVHQFEVAFSLDSTVFASRGGLVFGYSAAGRWSDAFRQRALLGRDVNVNSANYAPMISHLALGEYEAAMTSLERGFGSHEPRFGLLSVPCDPILDPLHANPRFLAIVRMIGGTACPVTTRWPISIPPALSGACEQVEFSPLLLCYPTMARSSVGHSGTGRAFDRFRIRTKSSAHH